MAAVITVAAVFGGTGLAVVPAAAERSSAPVQMGLRILPTGRPDGTADPTTAAWEASLQGEGVAYRLATPAGGVGSETVTLPGLTDPANTQHADSNGVVLSGTGPATLARTPSPGTGGERSPRALRSLPVLTAREFWPEHRRLLRKAKFLCLLSPLVMLRLA